jgi:hypothetical protein
MAVRIAIYMKIRLIQVSHVEKLHRPTDRFWDGLSQKRSDADKASVSLDDAVSGGQTHSGSSTAFLRDINRKPRM